MKSSTPCHKLVHHKNFLPCAFRRKTHLRWCTRRVHQLGIDYQLLSPRIHEKVSLRTSCSWTTPLQFINIFTNKDNRIMDNCKTFPLSPTSNCENASNIKRVKIARREAKLRSLFVDVLIPTRSRVAFPLYSFL